VPGGPANSVSFLIARVGFGSASRLSKRLEPFGFGLRQFAMLNQLALAEGQSQQAIADGIGIPKSRMVAMVDELEQRGLVERRQGDRRTHALHLTDEGRDVLQRTRRAAREHDAELTKALSDAERAQLVALLQKLVAEQELPIGVPPGLTRP
jgi:DNA-binding MarR family transcriptional regulator